MNQVLAWYERLERDTLEFGEKVPLTPQNESLQSPFLATTLIDACSLLDSVFRDMTPDHVVIDGASKKKSECKIPDFAQLHTAKLDLPNTRSLMLVSPPSYRIPFKAWEPIIAGNGYRPLPWWQASNELKHDCLTNLDRATLGVTLDALCALNQVLAKRLDIIPFLMRRGWFPLGGLPVDYILKRLEQGQLPDVFVVQTELFAVPVGQPLGASPGLPQFPEALSELEPWRYKCKPELIAFLGRV